jgi:GTP-binding protein Era
MTFRSGFVAVVGRPNVGKSTLVNALVGEKVSIVTDKPQTTRARIRGILTTGSHQIVFTDTPGFHKPRTLLGQRLNQMVEESTADVEVVVHVVDGAAGIGRGDAFVAERRVKTVKALKVCAVNKIDLVKEPQLMAQLQAASELVEFDHLVPVSAKSGRGLEELLEVLVGALPEGPRYFEPEEVTDQPLELRIAEIVREKALALTRDELPHSVATQLEEMERGEKLMRIACVILVERDSQKGIVIGKGGAMLKKIGTRAREELELMLGMKVHLELRVRVQKEWQRDPRALTRLGY